MSKYHGVTNVTALFQSLGIPGTYWKASLILGKVIHHLGYFEDEAEAAAIYNGAVKQLGARAPLNNTPSKFRPPDQFIIFP